MQVVTQISLKIHQVREELDYQARAIEEAQSRLELLTSRFEQLEQQNRTRELKIEREIQRLDDERWMRGWDKFCIEKKDK